jgi:sortase A
VTITEDKTGAITPGAPPAPPAVPPMYPPAGGGRPPRPPKPPRRPPRPAPQYAPMTPMQALLRGALALVAAFTLMFVVDLLVLSPIQHFSSQQQLLDTYRTQLAAGTAPVSEGDFNDVLLADGAPVGIISIPRLGLSEVIVEGTSSGELNMGPGHRRDTVLPGQMGVSVIMGRATAFGGPFGGLQTLQPGDTIEVRTGQGLSTFEVMGLRYAGDPTPPNLTKGESRMILMTARGAPYVPTGVAYVDAKLTSDAQAAGKRQTTPLTLAPADKPLATDTTTVWALVFALQFLVVAEIAAVWAFRRVGAQKTWIVFAPVLLLACLFTADQITRLLPNLL